MKSLIVAIKMLIVMTVLTGIVYPLFIYVIGQLCFPHNANGSLIKKGDKFIGSELIAQKFESDKYFHSRPSSIDYNPLPSGASNYGLTSKKLIAAMSDNRKNFMKQNHLTDSSAVPSDMLFASGSGLDPDISPEAAYLQIQRIAKARNMSKTEIKDLVNKQIEKPQFNLLGEPRVNVLLLNLGLDKIP